MNSFDDISIENLTMCQEDGIQSGLQTRIYYAPVSWFYGTVLPSSGSLSESVTIAANDLEMLAGKNWSHLDCLIDENELRALLSGSVGRLKLRSQLNVFIIGFRTNVLGFFSQLANLPMVFAIPDTAGNTWIFGNKRNPARIQSAEGTTGKTYTDNNGFTATIAAGAPVYKFAGDIWNLNPSAADFNTDFNNDLLI